MTQDRNHTFVKALKALFVTAMMLLTGSNALAQGVVVNGNVFGGGNLAEVKGSVTVNIKAGTVVNDVYGGGALAHTNTANTTNTSDNTTKVFLLGGTINHNVYGGGLGEKDKVNGATADNPAYVNGDVKISLNGLEKADYDAGIHGTLGVSEVDPDGDTSTENYYKVSTGGCVVKGSVFGCNNLCGTPKGKVKVHVFKTVGDGGDTYKRSTDKGNTTYELTAVYGGGDMAAYEPTDATSNDETKKNNAHTEVIIEGCGDTSIGQVYGGGNAASTPSTNVTINGSYEIGEVFGGGNGAGTVTIDNQQKANPGANVGFHDYSAVESQYPTKTERQTTAFTNTYVYGSGKASVNIFGGMVHRVFGGSNTKGNVRITAITMLEDKNGCDFCMDEAYGGGKSAPMDAEAKLHMACIPGLKAAYGGAEAADVLGDVTLNITNGTFDRVFGGNNLSGTISGSITVNIEETGCKPIIIGELYGGGNEAAYSVFGYKKSGDTNVIRTSMDDGTAFYTPTTSYSSNQLFADPQVNVKSFTSIGNIYGGGLGATATMVGNPTVNVNVANGIFYNHDDAVVADGTKTSGNYPVPSHAKGNIGAINNVYGGGNAADVVGNTNVNIGTEEYVFVTKEYAVNAALSENCYTRTGAGTAASPYAYTSTSGNAAENTTYYERIAVVGADIRGDVYGGGYGAATTVTGNVVVNIGGQKTDGTFIGGNIAIGGSVYGGSALGAVNATKGTGSVLSYTDGKTTAVTLKKGNVSRYVFGGGMGNANTTAHVYGPTTVTLYGDVVAGGLYGGCDANGEMHNGTQLDLFGGTVGQYSAPTADILFGGGLGKDTKVDGNVTVNVGSKDYTGNTSVTIWGNVYGGGALGDVNMPKTATDASVYTTLVNLYKGTVHGNVFGGGLGQAAKAAVGEEGQPGYQPAVPKVEPAVKGKVRVDLNGYNGIITDPDNENYNASAFGSCIVTGSIFGCNNTEGSPENDVEVHIYKTVGTGSNVRSANKDNTTFDLAAVYGGGNKAAFATANKTTKVYIETCDVSINEVYGGGFGADVPATYVEVNGAYEIGTVYGGGYGASTTDFTNPGANVNGSTDVLLKGGVIHEVYGGSNTKGNVVEGSNVNVSDGSGCCDLKVDNIYGGGKKASMAGGTSIVLGCQPDTWIEDIYAGSREADVDGDVSLTITSGKFERVFGGNKTSGKLKGSITVNIEETGSCGTPIIIGELYAGGNEADYSIYGYKADGTPMTADELRTKLTTENPGKTAAEIDALFQTTKKDNPQLNVRAFTSIGAVYGGGYSAKMYANPTVSISVVKGSRNTTVIGENQKTPTLSLSYPAHAQGAIGAIGNVFGGGNLATVDGSTTVNIGTKRKIYFKTEPAHLGTEGTDYVKQTNGSFEATVEGVNVTGNVYGGGNQADVTGNTQVNICAVYDKDNDKYDPVAEGASKVTIGGDVFGAGKGLDTNPEAALLHNNSTIVMAGGSVKKSVYGGGELSQVARNTNVSVLGGTIGTPNTSTNVYGGATYGNVYGGGKGSDGTGNQSDLIKVQAGLVKGNTKITISDGTILHNIYGGGAYGSVGTFNYDTNGNITPDTNGKVCADNTGKAEIIITGGTFGTTGKENGMIFGSSRGDVGDLNSIHNKLAWVYNTDVKIGTSGSGDVYNTPTIRGSVYGGGENGHNYHDADVYFYSGTIGIESGEKVTSGGKDYEGAAYPYRGNVYGGGCGTDKYYSYTPIPEGHTATDGEGDKYNPLAGIVYGNATVNISGGRVVHNVYGAGAMGSVGKTNTDGSFTGGQTTINISDGIIGVDGTAGEGNVFGAARGSLEAPDNNLALVAGNASVSITGGTMYGNVYGGGELGYVGKYTSETNTENGSKTYTWPANSGVCNITINGAAATVKGNVFGAGKGSADTYECEPAMVSSTNVSISKGTVEGNVYGGGQLGRVENNTTVTIGAASGTDEFEIKGGVFGAGAGVATHGYSALVRGNASVTVQGKAKIGKNVYGGGETASVGKFKVVNSLPKEPLNGGTCTVTIQGDAKVGTGSDGGCVYGACKGVEPDYANNAGHWMSDNQSHAFEGENAESEYLAFLKTLALTSNTNVTIGGNASVNGSVYGGGRRGITLGNVSVDMTGGTVNKDVYGGGALADTNTGNATGYGTDSESLSSTSNFTTTVNLLGGLIKGDAYGGGLGRLAREADPTNNITAQTAIPAKVYGDVAVTLGDENKTNATAFTISKYENTDVVKSGRIFGCNNLNGSPLGNVKVTIWNTISRNADGTKKDKPTINTETYELAAVYGGGNLANYVPTTTDAKDSVKIMTCDVSVREVYGGGNAAAVPETNVLVNGAHEIQYVFGGGNGKDDYTLDDGVTWKPNQGADVVGSPNTLLKGGYVHEAYGGSNERGNIGGAVKINTASGGDCTLDCKKIVAAGRNADLSGDAILVMGCVDGAKIEQVIGGADNANVSGNVELTITSGEFGKVFGGNNLSGIITGHIKVNIEETGCTPIKIDELYLGGNEAAYSIYGYYQAGTDANGKPIYKPRTSANDEHECVNNPNTDATHSFPYANPELNVISCTYIGKVFGGGYGEGGAMYANPTVNINMIPGAHANSVPDVMTAKGFDYNKENPHKLGVIGDVFGGGNAAEVIGNPTVNIGTKTTVQLHESYNATTRQYAMSDPQDVEGAYITGDVFGGGNEANATGKTQVNICAVEADDPTTTDVVEYASVTPVDAGVTIRGSKPANGFGRGVFGAGNEGVVNGDSYVYLGGGSVLQSVYGGGCNADVTGNTHLTMLGGYVFDGVCGGGLKGSVGTFTSRDYTLTTDKGTDIEFNHSASTHTCIGKPTVCKSGTGTCYVVISGGQVGPVELATKGMTRSEAEGGPVSEGWVWGAGRGLIEDPKYHPDTHFLTYVNETDVTIKDDAFIVGSIIGGGEFGRVLGNTLVKIEGGQIGVGKDQVTTDGLKPKAYTAEQWAEAEAAVRPSETSDVNAVAAQINAIAEKMPACSHWEYGKKVDGKDVYDTYDPYAKDYPNLYPGGSTYQASDGKTWTGCVFGGGSGYFPYLKEDGGYDWARSAGWVEGNTEVRISGGHIMTNVYGGNEYTDVKGTSKVTMTGGTIGVPRTVSQIEKLPMTGFLFGAGKGDPRTHFNKFTNVQDVEIKISGGTIFGSVYGGSEDGHVLGNVNITIDKNADPTKDPVIGTWGTSYFDGNVFGGGRGFSGEAQTAGSVGGNVALNIKGGSILGNVFGGGRLASVGTQFTFPDDDNYGNFVEDEGSQTYGYVTVNISGGTIGSNRSKTNIGGNDVERAQFSGNVFGGSMGRLTLLNGSVNPIWPKMAQVKNSDIKISGGTIYRNVYGGGEFGTVRDNAHVTISGGTVRRDVFGGGYGSDNDDVHTIFTVKELEDDNNYHEHTYAFTPMQFAGCVGKSTTVDITGGYVRKSVYGGGEMASVGVINYRVEKLNGASTSDKVVIHDETSNEDYYYTNMVKHGDETKEFALSWPFEFNYVPGYEGATHVNITGGRLGLRGNEKEESFQDNGDVYGGGMGFAGEYKDYVFCANVGSADVSINYPATVDPSTYKSDGDCIAGAVYAGGENGHVMGNATLTLKNGLVGHSIYGGGSGKGTYEKQLLKIGSTTETYTRKIYSITAGKVFGNCEVDMSGGYVVRNVYGGGNMGSVGKGNYAGGEDDYYPAGYGEKLSGENKLWDGGNKFSQAFLNSGKCTVKITGGTVGYIGTPLEDYMKDGMLYGNVFGGCRGESAPNIVESPRYLYSPEFFVGYANETAVEIGETGKPGPTIWGSVYGGGQDGHVRRDASVTINSGEIGFPYDAAKYNETFWLQMGNVYGAGSGIGKYKFDFNNDKKYDGRDIEYTNPTTGRTSKVNEEDYSTSAGSVTRFTTVNINGGIIHRNVYGGGSLSSVGAPKIPPTRTDELFIRDDTDAGKITRGKQSLNRVTISGNAQIGDATSYGAGYGGHVFGGSRGDKDLSDPSSFATAVWTDVNIAGGAIAGDVYGGGEVGTVRQSTDVALTGGIVTHDVYGGGKGTDNVAANISGDATVTLNESVTAKGCVVDRIFGANNVNGTPKGHAKVHVFATQNANTTKVNEKIDGQYDVAYVFGGGNASDYVPTDATQSTEVIIEGCDLSSIKEVYGGGYGAAVPGTNVLVKGTKIINEVFGGGYGAGDNNPGANVGYRTATSGVYGNETENNSYKTAVVRLMAGNINNVYGGSNTKGDIRGGASVTNEINTHDTGCCENLHVGQIYGGGKDAEMKGGTEIILGCMPNDWIEEIYAGAQNADVGNDVSLTLTSGKFGRVFGGNKTSGRLHGSIEVNIEENPECDVPLVIGELYGGGNEAPYSIYGYKNEQDSNGKWIPRQKSDYDAMTASQKEEEGIGSAPHNSPRLNVCAFTSIGNIFGGGYGQDAVMVGSPTVNINEVVLTNANGTNHAYDPATDTNKPVLIDGVNVKLYPHEAGKIGVIGNVFGGGNAAKVVGDTNVNIGNKQSVTFASIEDDPTTTVKENVKQVVGADIRGNVYGGGNNADVTGKTNVLIGNEVQQAQ